MTNAQLKQEVIAYSKSIGIDKIGFASADPFVQLKSKLETQQQLGYQSGFEEPNIEKRVNPDKVVKGAQSIIAIALAYPSRMENPPKGTRNNRRGIFCRASWGLDYHHILRDRLQKLEKFITEKVPEAKTTSMVDTGPLVDRAVAERAGIGWSGKNCSIITPEFGSYVYLGEIVTTVSFEPDVPITDMCGSCTRCIDACPTGALVQGGQLNAQKCIAFLTQSKDFIPEKFRNKIGNRLYGCDTCQQVCPMNKGMDHHIHKEMEPEPELVKPTLVPLLSLSNRQFKNTFGHMSGSWRGKNPIQRNAIIALAHFKDEESVSILTEYLIDDHRPLIRGTTAWALGKIGGIRAKEKLLEAKKVECDEKVLQEIEAGLKAIELKK